MKINWTPICDNVETTYSQLHKEYLRLQAENEALKRDRAMLVEALSTCRASETSMHMSFHANKVKEALSATEQQSQQWLNEKMAEALEEAKRRIYSGEFDPLCAEDALQEMAFALRSQPIKGE